MKIWKIAFLGLMATLISASAFAGDVSLPNGPYLIADGSATYEAVPDFVKIKFSISKTAPTTAAASAIVDKESEAVFKVLKSHKIPDKDIRASSINVSEDYDDSGSKQVYKGQQVSRDFKVTLYALQDYSGFIRDLLKTNIDSISDITFNTTRYSEDEAKVMRMAIDDAHTHADIMAKQLGAVLGEAYAAAPQAYRSYMINGFPMQGEYGLASPVPNAVPPPPPGYVVPKSISISYDVTIVYSMTYGK